MKWLDPKPGQLTAAAFHGPLAALGSREGVLDLHEIPGGKHRLRARPFDRSVAALAFSGNGGTLVAASEGGDLALVPMAGGAPIAIDGGMSAAHARAALSFDGRQGVASFTTFYHGHEGTRFVRFEGGKHRFHR